MASAAAAYGVGAPLKLAARRHGALALAGSHRCSGWKSSVSCPVPQAWMGSCSSVAMRRVASGSRLIVQASNSGGSSLKASLADASLLTGKVVFD